MKTNLSINISAVTISFVLLWSNCFTAEKLQFSFQVISMDRNLADAFLQRALGESIESSEILSKVPDLIEQNRVSVVTEFNAQTESGQRSKHVSSDKKLPTPDEQSYADGLTIELDPILGSDGITVDANMYIIYARKLKGDVHLRTLTTQVTMRSGEYSLLSQWEDGDDIMFLICLPKTSESKTPQRDGKLESFLMTDIAYFKDLGDYEAKRAPIARTILHSRSGNRAKAESIVPSLIDFGGPYYLARGLVTTIDGVIKRDTDQINLNLEVKYAFEPKRKVNVGGRKQDKVEIYTVKSSLEMESGEEKVMDVMIEGLHGEKPRKSGWVAVIKCYRRELLSLYDQYKLLKVSMVDEPYSNGVNLAKQNYANALQRNIQQAGGNTAALQGELTSLKNDALDLSVDPTDPGLLNLRNIYRKLLADEEQKRAENLAKLKASFPGIEIEEEVEKVADEPVKPATPEVSPPMTESKPKKVPQRPAETTGRLMIEGTMDGKPINLPAKYKNMPVDWIYGTGPRLIFGNATDGAFVLSSDGVEPIETGEPVKMYTMGSSWKGTSLNYDNELKWMNNKKKRGMLPNVVKYDVGGGPKHGALIALRESGRIDLLLYGIEMEWDFKSWAAERKFKDVAITRWRGIEAVALAVTTDGELFAFNHQGLYQLPPEVKNEVASVSSGNVAIHVAVMKDNGEIHEFARGISKDYPNDTYLMKWRKSPPRISKDKKPDAYICGNYARAVRYEDGSCQFIVGRGIFGKPIFSEFSQGKTFKDAFVSHVNDKGMVYAAGIVK